MTRTSSILLTSGGGSSTGTISGPRNKIEVFCGPHNDDVKDSSWSHWGTSASYTWTKPTNIKADVPLRVYVWGPGGNSGCNSESYGGGGGGYSYKEIAVASVGSTETITIGMPSTNQRNSRGAASSFGSHCSANGGNDGANPGNPSGNPNSTGENSNPQTSSYSGYGQGGIGVGGDINRRGGQGGFSHSCNPGSGSGGGGGSAPAPQITLGHHDGYTGGSGHSSYQCGSGASIAFPGSVDVDNWSGGNGGAGTAGWGSAGRWGDETRRRAGHGGAGLFGAGGRGASVGGYSNNDQAKPNCMPGGSGKGGAIWDPNGIILGGGGGGGGNTTTWSSARSHAVAGCGGPGAGGGATQSYQSSNNGECHAGQGGVLGGGGGANQYNMGGCGGAGGGAGSSGWDGEPEGRYGWAMGGTGLVVVTYAVE